ncbi:MAG: methyltransferase domain-containing protein [Planctomycetes bacterium]|nr:methyltransferase domain-containing protein [Planctomycetota bacterium]MBI3834931.1 methyltransferase domain-containing protein [Planctomycetota bacterium]
MQESLYTFPYHHIPNWSAGRFEYFRARVPSCEYASYIRHLVNRAKAAPFNSVLDLGCGDGRLCAELRVAYPSARIVGVDVSERAIAFARAFAPRLRISLCGYNIERCRPWPIRSDLHGRSSGTHRT